MPIRNLDIASLDTSGAQYGANLTYVASNAAFEWVSGVYSSTPSVSPQQSENYGYSINGRTLTSGTNSPGLYSYDKYSLTSDSNATSSPAPVGRVQAVGGMSATHGYSVGGYNPNTTPASPRTDVDKLAFSGDTWSTNIGPISNPSFAAIGINDRVGGHHYHYGGTPNITVNEKQPHASDTAFSSVGTTAPGHRYGMNASSPTNGYVMGGISPVFTTPSPQYTQVLQFPFSSDVDATNIGNLMPSNQPNNQGRGFNSDVSAYAAGMSSSAPGFNNIYKFPFASNTSMTDVGTLFQGRYFGGSASSTTHGFYEGGRISGSNSTNTIDKFPFSSDTNASDVANLTSTRNEQTSFNY